jgi:hypothetical protein
MSASIKGLIIAVSFAVLSMMMYFWFLKKDNYFVMDNPTSSKIEVEWNSKKIILSPFEIKKIEVNEGSNRLFFKEKNGNQLDTILNIKGLRGVINPTKTTYYIFTQLYGVVKNKDSIMLSQSTIIKDKVYFGNIKKDSSLFIQDFYFNLDEPYQKLIKNIDTIEKRKKIFREKEFINYYNQNFK